MRFSDYDGTQFSSNATDDDDVEAPDIGDTGEDECWWILMQLDDEYDDDEDDDDDGDDDDDAEDECWWILVQLGRRGMSPLGIHQRPNPTHMEMMKIGM